MARSRIVDRTFSWRGAAKAVAPIYTVWLLPATLGAILDWHWWITYTLLIPGTVWYLATEGVRYYREAQRSDPKAPWGTRVPAFSLLGMAMLLTLWEHTRFFGLFLAAGLIMMDLFSYERLKSKRDRLGA
jgi:hypothetical protein